MKRDLLTNQKRNIILFAGSLLEPVEMNKTGKFQVSQKLTIPQTDSTLYQDNQIHILTWLWYLFA